MEKWTVKNIKIHRIKSEDIVADIKDTILRCQPFKVQTPFYLFLTFLPSVTSKCTEKTSCENKTKKNPSFSKRITTTIIIKKSHWIHEINMTIKNKQTKKHFGLAKSKDKSQMMIRFFFCCFNHFWTVVAVFSQKNYIPQKTGFHPGTSS